MERECLLSGGTKKQVGRRFWAYEMCRRRGLPEVKRCISIRIENNKRERRKYLKTSGRQTSFISKISKSAFRIASWINRVKPPKTLLASNSYLVLLMVEIKSIPSARLSTLKLAFPPKLNALFVASASSFSLAKLFGFSRGSVLCFRINSLAK